MSDMKVEMPLIAWQNLLDQLRTLLKQYDVDALKEAIEYLHRAN